MATLITLRNKAGEVTRYRVRYNYRPLSIDGKEYDQREFAASREKAAKAFKRKVEKVPAVARGGSRIVDITDAYLASTEFEQLEMSSQKGVEIVIRVRIVPGIGKLRHDRITGIDVKQWLEALVATGFDYLSTPDRNGAQKRRPARPVAVPTANQALRYLKAIMRWARVEGLTTSYAVDEVKALKDRRPADERREQARAYSREEKDLLLAACETLQERTVLAFDWDSGLRRGELFAVHWESVNFGTKPRMIGGEMVDPGEVRVLHALNPDGSLKDPKTHEIRTVAILDEGWEALQAWHAHVKSARGAEPTGLVFHTEDGLPLDGEWEARHAGQYRRRRPTDKPGTPGAEEVRVLLPGIRERSGIHLQLGHCRDSFASELIAAGVGVVELSLAMGHESVETTRRHYSAWLKARRSQVRHLVRAARAARAALATA